jgi:hypothetical protein
MKLVVAIIKDSDIMDVSDALVENDFLRRTQSNDFCLALRGFFAAWLDIVPTNHVSFKFGINNLTIKNLWTRRRRLFFTRYYVLQLPYEGVLNNGRKDRAESIPWRNQS